MSVKKGNNLFKMKPIDRVREIIKYKNITIGAFEKLTGMSNNSIQTALKRRSSLRDDTLNNILSAFQDVNPEWLLTGDGEMLKSQTSQIAFEKPSLESLQCKIKLLKQNLADKERVILSKDQIIQMQTSRIKELENKQPPSS